MSQARPLSESGLVSFSDTHGLTGRENGHLSEVTPDEQPLILTLKLDSESQEFFDSMRERHFPPERNFIGAHVTLFHKLPGELADGLSDDIESICAEYEPFPVEVTKLRSLGRGVAYVLVSERLETLRRDFVREWKPYLGAQDRQKSDFHVTVQNKVTPDESKALLAGLQATFEPFEVAAEGVVLWRYLGGPWEEIRRFAFGG